MKKNRIFITILIIIFFLLFILVKTEILLKLDINILEYIKNFRSKSLTSFMKFYTEFAVNKLIFLIAALLLFTNFNDKIKTLAILNSIFVVASNKVLKLIFRISRPAGFMLIKEDGYSFPSGHSTIAASFYLLLMYLVYINIKNKYLKYSLITVLSIMILLVGFSRMYLGVHYPSDVLAGYLAGLILLLIEIEFLKKEDWKYGKSIRSKKSKYSENRSN